MQIDNFWDQFFNGGWVGISSLQFSFSGPAKTTPNISTNKSTLNISLWFFGYASQEISFYWVHWSWIDDQAVLEIRSWGRENTNADSHDPEKKPNTIDIIAIVKISLELKPPGSQIKEKRVFKTLSSSQKGKKWFISQQKQYFHKVNVSQKGFIR